jgi:hypothetical protein
VAVEVEMVIPVDDPSEPCLEAESVQFLKHVKEHAALGERILTPFLIQSPIVLRIVRSHRNMPDLHFGF